MFLDVLKVCGDKMGIVSAEVLEDDWFFESLVVAMIA